MHNLIIIIYFRYVKKSFETNIFSKIKQPCSLRYIVIILFQIQTIIVIFIRNTLGKAEQDILYHYCLSSQISFDFTRWFCLIQTEKQSNMRFAFLNCSLVNEKVYQQGKWEASITPNLTMHDM